MDVILHVGAHRCASTTFQHYMRLNSERLVQQGIGFWGPRRTRDGLFRGILPGPCATTRRDQQRRGIGRVQMNLSQSALRLRSLIVSDENMLGSVRENVRAGELYPSAGDRLTRFYQAFQGHVTDVMLNIRSPDTYWASALGYRIVRGRSLPEPNCIDRLAGSGRSWRDVITEVACAMPDSRLWILPFETYASRPEAQLGAVAAVSAPKSHSRKWMNATPNLPELRDLVGPEQAEKLPCGDGRWRPFRSEQIAAMREDYADDIMWLIAGADGLARMTGVPDKKRAGLNPSLTDDTRGRPNDNQERRMEGAG